MWVLTDERDGKFNSSPFCHESRETLMLLAAERAGDSYSEIDDVNDAIAKLDKAGEWVDGDCTVRLFFAEEYKPGGD